MALPTKTIAKLAEYLENAELNAEPWRRFRSTIP